MRRAMDVLRLDSLAGDAAYYAISWHVHGALPWARRDYLEVLAVTEGRGILSTLDDADTLGSHSLEPGRVMVLRPRDSYRVLSDDPGGMGGYVVSMPISAWLDFSHLVGLDSWWLSTPEPPHAEFRPDDPTVIEPFERIVTAFQRGPEPLDLAAFLVAITPVLLPSSETGERRRDIPAWLAESVESMRSEANLRIGLPRLTALTRVSASHLSRAVRRFYGVTPTELVLSLRVNRAAVLLTRTGEPINQIARRCGFASPSHFGAAFRSAFQTSPRAYRFEHAGIRGAPTRGIREVHSGYADAEDPRVRAARRPGRAERVVIVGS